jgi:hypothetical protein
MSDTKFERLSVSEMKDPPMKVFRLKDTLLKHRLRCLLMMWWFMRFQNTNHALGTSHVLTEKGTLGTSSRVLNFGRAPIEPQQISNSRFNTIQRHWAAVSSG